MSPLASSPVRLTSLSHGAGCACKLSPADLDEVLRNATLARRPDPDLIVGLDTGDDAAVYRLDAERAIVVTTDFFTPIVDDPRTWGRIAAVNALSDVYAMGGEPLVALNLVAWPRETLPFALLGEVLDGAAEAVAEAGAVIGGGHSIDDAEPKFGLAVVGQVHPDRILTNAGARPGDDLVLTKPLGIGAVTTALKRDVAPPALLDAAVTVMGALNRGAAAAARAVGIGPDAPIHAGTDVTGFGLLGHLREMAVASGVAAEVNVGAVPVLSGTLDLLSAGCVAGGTRRNRAWVGHDTDWGGAPEPVQHLLADAQTSGGLLLACDPDATPALLSALRDHRVPVAHVIGRIVADRGPRLSVRP